MAESKTKDNNLHFAVGVIAIAISGYMMFALRNEKLSDGLQGALLVGVVGGIVLIVRYPFQRSKY